MLLAFVVDGEINPVGEVKADAAMGKDEEVDEEETVSKAATAEECGDGNNMADFGRV